MTLIPRTTFAQVAALAALAASTTPLAAQTARPGSSYRTELEDLRSVLETAVSREHRAARLAGVRAPGRAYRLKGYGAVIVLAPRPLSARRIGFPPGAAAEPSGRSRLVIQAPQGTFDISLPDLGDLERELVVQMDAQVAAFRELEAAREEWTTQREDQMREHLRSVEEQAEAFRREAERARRQVERQVRTRLVPPPLPAPPAVPALSRPDTPPAPDAPEPPEPPELVEPPEPPPPPWLFWFDAPGARPQGGSRAPDPRSAESLVASVRERLIAGLETYRHRLATLEPDEFITVAVDFVPDLALRALPARTLLVRVRARDLQELQAGRLSRSDFRTRVESDEN